MSATTSLIPDVLVTTYLQMTDENQFRPAFLEGCSGLSVKTMEEPDVAFYRFLYSSVGEQWKWRDRLLLPEHELKSLLAAPETSVHVLYVGDVPAGYVELAQSDDSTEIAYFGLCPDYMGKGLGKHLLSYGIAQAWNNGAKRLWVHTCNLDGPYALDNYIKRGFSIYKVDEQPMPERYL
jgi:GNAT superfamily N-acetyltransferase